MVMATTVEIALQFKDKVHLFSDRRTPPFAKFVLRTSSWAAAVLVDAISVGPGKGAVIRIDGIAGQYENIFIYSVGDEFYYEFQSDFLAEVNRKVNPRKANERKRLSTGFILKFGSLQVRFERGLVPVITPPSPAKTRAPAPVIITEPASKRIRMDSSESTEPPFPGIRPPVQPILPPSLRQRTTTENTNARASFETAGARSGSNIVVEERPARVQNSGYLPQIARASSHSQFEKTGGTTPVLGQQPQRIPSGNVALSNDSATSARTPLVQTFEVVNLSSDGSNESIASSTSSADASGSAPRPNSSSTQRPSRAQPSNPRIPGALRPNDPQLGADDTPGESSAVSGPTEGQNDVRELIRQEKKQRKSLRHSSNDSDATSGPSEISGEPATEDGTPSREAHPSEPAPNAKAKRAAKRTPAARKTPASANKVATSINDTSAPTSDEPPASVDSTNGATVEAQLPHESQPLPDGLIRLVTDSLRESLMPDLEQLVGQVVKGALGAEISRLNQEFGSLKAEVGSISAAVNGIKGLVDSSSSALNGQVLRSTATVTTANESSTLQLRKSIELAVQEITGSIDQRLGSLLRQFNDDVAVSMRQLQALVGQRSEPPAGTHSES